METFWIKALQLILSLSLLVVIHEFGHYFFARIFGIKVEKFYLFFNPWFSLFKWKPKKSKHPKLNADGTEKPSWRDTEYGIGWLPFGGYCKIAGMIDESMDKEQMAQPAKPDEFRSKPAWQRLLVMIGGVLFNFILAIIIYAGIAFYWGEKVIEFRDNKVGYDFSPTAQQVGFKNGDIPLMADGEPLKAVDDNAIIKMAEAKKVTVLRDNTPVDIAVPENFVLKLDNDKWFLTPRFPVVVKSLQGGAAKEAGLEPGDSVIAIGGVPTPAYTEFVAELDGHKGKPTDITVVRKGKELTLPITPNDNGKLGIELTPPTDIYPVTVVDYSLLESVPKGIDKGVNRLTTYVGSLKYLFTKDGATSMGGFGAIGNMFPDRWNWLTFWEMTAFLSVILAFMNIIPIPALDGGHVMFTLWEIITRRKPSEKFLEYAQMVGMLFLLTLLLYANGLDILRAMGITF